MTNPKITLFFDLGDTLIYRREKHQILDRILLTKLFPSFSSTEITEAIDQIQSSFPGLYDYRSENNLFRNLDLEDNYTFRAFQKLFIQLNLDSSDLKLFLSSRKNDQRYYLFPGAIDLLIKLKNTGQIDLGILSNGRPSRREIMQKLNIYHFFHPELVIISDEIGLSKPNSDIFRYAQQIVSDEVVRIALIDDEFQNIAQAKKMNFQTFFVPSPPDYKHIFDYCMSFFR